MCDSAKTYLVFYYSASAEFCLRICLKASRYMLSKPPKAQATSLPAFSSSCEMENRDQQNRFLRPIQDSDRQGDRNPRVFLKAKAIPASSQLNPDRDKIFQFSGQQLPTSKFGQDNPPKIFRFGAHQELTPTLNILQDCAGENPAPSHFSTFTSLGSHFCNSTVPLVSRFGEVKSTHEPQVNGKYGRCSTLISWES